MTALGDMNPLYRLEGWLGAREGDHLAELASEVPDGQVIVELGSYRGKSSSFLAYGSASGFRRPVYCVDLWAKGGQWETDVARRQGVALHHDDPAHYDAFKENTAPYSDLIVEVNRHSHRAGQSWTGGRTIGLLFVDADHRYEGCLGDLEAWVPHVVDAGFVAIHDYINDDYPGVQQACHEFLESRARIQSYVVQSMLVVQLCDT